MICLASNEIENKGKTTLLRSLQYCFMPNLLFFGMLVFKCLNSESFNVYGFQMKLS